VPYPLPISYNKDCKELLKSQQRYVQCRENSGEFDSFDKQSTEVTSLKLELQNAKRQCSTLKSLLNDAMTEKDIMYEVIPPSSAEKLNLTYLCKAFNEELDGMYKDINLPDDPAWAAMTKDLRHTKEDRNNLLKENS
jgi:protein ECT2